MNYDTLNTFIKGEIPVELPTGWHRTFIEMVGVLKDFLDTNGISAHKMYFLQIKEKYGEMRIYTSFANDVPIDVGYTCDKIVEQYCQKTANICWQCGEHATYYSKSWILPWCSICADHEADERNVAKENLFEESLSCAKKIFMI